MKIAIITWFHYRNYGTALQVTATYRYLRELGHTVDIINYKPYSYFPEPIHDYNIKYLLSKIKSKLFSTKYSIPFDYDNSQKKQEKFSDFLSNNLTFTAECSTLSDLCELNGKYDAFICGSDQIWAPTLFDSHYFLDFVTDDNKKIAYAPSLGLPKIDNRHVKCHMRNLLLKFKHLSVREDKGQEIIESLTGQKAKLVCDPTMLLSAQDWNKICKQTAKDEAPYILVYMLGKNDRHWSAVQKLSKEKKLPLKIIPVFSSDTKRIGCINTPIGPSEFVALIANASIVCTDSFHGIIFSINYNKQFVPFERFPSNNTKNQNSRVYNILSLVGLTKSLVKYNDSTTKYKKIEYRTINNTINAFRNKSIEFLTVALSSAEKSKATISKHILSANDLCCGCGACAHTCPTSAIKVGLNNNGFFHAMIDPEHCVNCGKCLKVCPYAGNNIAKEVKDCDAYSFKAHSSDVLLKSSSGGFAYLFSAHLIEQGYSIVGCTYDKETQTARHILVNSIDELEKLQGSKYMQSDFRSIIPIIKEHYKPIAVFGTPCQIAAVKKCFPTRNDIIYIDLLCHGVPSYNLYRKYLTYLEAEYGLKKSEISTIFRYKPKSWQKIHLCNKDRKSSVVLYQKEDPYFHMFEKGACYSKACYECRWRDRSVADIRIADYWGERFANDTTGVSMIIQISTHGKEFIDRITNHIRADICKQNISDCLNCQQMRNFPIHTYYDELIELLKTNYNDIVYLADKYTMFSKEDTPTNTQKLKRFLRINKFERNCRKRLK